MQDRGGLVPKSWKAMTKLERRVLSILAETHKHHLLVPQTGRMRAPKRSCRWAVVLVWAIPLQAVVVPRGRREPCRLRDWYHPGLDTSNLCSNSWSIEVTLPARQDDVVRLRRVHREAAESIFAVGYGDQSTWPKRHPNAAQLRALKEIQTMHFLKVARVWYIATAGGAQEAAAGLCGV